MDKIQEDSLPIGITWENFLTSYSEEHIDAIIDAFVKDSKEKINPDDIVGEIIEIPNNNGIIVVRHNNKTMGTVTFLDGLVYVGLYKMEEAYN